VQRVKATSGRVVSESRGAAALIVEVCGEAQRVASPFGGFVSRFSTAIEARDGDAAKHRPDSSIPG
jgi:hypothetical protein